MEFGILSNVMTNWMKAATSVSAFQGAQCQKITLGTDVVNKTLHSERLNRKIDMKLYTVTQQCML